MSIAKNFIFNYKRKEFVEVPHQLDATCESVCIYLSEQEGIIPSARLLFGLRITNTQNWLPPSFVLQPNVQYDFRMRFKVPNLSTLRKLDEHAYDYFYHQVRYDLVNDKISEIKYPAYKNNVLGLGVVDMHIDMIEKNISIENLEKNYKKYIPKELIKNHQYFAKKKIQKGLREIRKTDHDIFYVKVSYLESIRNMAPNYLIEEYSALANYLAEDELQNGTCPVTVQFNPFHEDQPGLRIFYKYKDEWKHMLRIENIYALYKEDNDTVKFEISNMPNGFRLFFLKSAEAESFITYIAGYYRLIVKWIYDVCPEFRTPSLEELKQLKIHGPIGGEFSYAKIREQWNKPGSYIIRECEKRYNTYYIDINLRGTETKTFQITRKNNSWHLHNTDDRISKYNNLTDLVNSMKTSSPHFQLKPSAYDKAPLLHICLPRNQLTMKKTVSEISEADLQGKRVQIIDPKIDLQWYKNSQKDCEGGKMSQMRADWILPGDLRLKVTLKILKSEKHFPEFMKLADRWSKMYSSEFLKLYGLTLTTPHTMVMEYAKFGALNEFLRQNRDNVSILCLLEAIHSLVRAMLYMHENKIIHGHIRCSSLQVVKFDSRKSLVAKLGDPGFPKNYKEDEKPWIPFEYHSNPEEAKQDAYAEFWAFATTVWEIFSRGKPIEKSVNDLRRNYAKFGGILPEPSNDCPPEIFKTILEGWSSDRDRRFCQQLIFSRLASIKQNYCAPYTNLTSSNGIDATSMSRMSDTSAHTDQTMVNLNHSSGSEPSISSNGDVSESSTRDKKALLPSRNSNARFYPTYPQGFFDETPSVFQLSNGKIICREKIGEGHYGTVYRGEYQFYQNKQVRQVAIKTLKDCVVDENLLKQDFMREIQIMLNLSHPNIVKILTYVDTPQISIIMEYIECGSFLVYLSSKPNLTNHKLLRFAYDIANGMDHLRSKHIIHRDLAARNILVDSDCVKISDFGLAQTADASGYYFARTEREIPIKWYAPETIRTNKFSFQSDVWSYGVTLFEMFSRGEKPNLDPNGDLSPEELLTRLEGGERLRQPEMCPDHIYNKLILPCWDETPKVRPNFKDIKGKIDEILLFENGGCL